jgi:hypothetical protein
VAATTLTSMPAALDTTRALDPHRLAELRSLAYHRAVAERLRKDPTLIDRARSRVEAWMRDPDRSPGHARAWKALLDRSLDELLAFMTEDSERARELRQSTPFAGFLSPRERWAIWSEVKRGSVG